MLLDKFNELFGRHHIFVGLRRVAKNTKKDKRQMLILYGIVAELEPLQEVEDHNGDPEPHFWNN